MKRGLFALLLIVAMSNGAGAQGAGHGQLGLDSLSPRMSHPSTGGRAAGTEPSNPGLVFPDSSFLGTNTPTGRALEGLEFNNELRNGMPSGVPDETPDQ